MKHGNAGFVLLSVSLTLPSSLFHFHNYMQHIKLLKTIQLREEIWINNQLRFWKLVCFKR